MEKLDTPVMLHRIADRMRLQAQETLQQNYREMMLRAADSLDREAERLTEAQMYDFCTQLDELSPLWPASASQH
jgi:hypothetical protein